MALRRLAPAVALLGAAACATRDPPLLEPLPPVTAGTGAAAARVNGLLGTPGVNLAPQVSLGTPTALGTAPAGTGISDIAPGAADISLDFADTDIREVVSQVLGGVLRVNYTIDPSVRGTATLRTPQPLNRVQALAALNTLLAQNGATVVQNNGLYRVLPIAAAASAGGGAAPAAGGVAGGGTAVPLRYASADDLARVLQPFVAGGGRVAADPGRNALIVSGDPATRDTLLSLIAAFDINILAGQSYAVFPVSAGDARDYATALQEALRGQSAGGGQGGGSLAGLVRVVPMQRINAVLVVSAQPRYVEDARRVYALVERTRRANVRGWSVYFLQNGRSNDIAYVLQQAFTPGRVTAQPTPAGGTAPGRQTRGVASTGGGTGTSGSGIGTSIGVGQRGGAASGGIGGSGGTAPSTGGSAALAPSAPAAGPDASANPLLGGLDPSEAGGGTGGAVESMRIIPHPQNNSLLVYATPQERETLETTLRRLDILPLQVRIDATIAEVTLNDQLQYGTQFFFRTGEFNGVLSTAVAAAATGGLNTAIPGFVFAGRRGDAGPLAISALQAVTDVRVLSSPQLVVLDNEPARLQVGQLVPFLTQSAQSTLTTGAPIVSSVDYRETGVIMEVTPRVNSGGLVTLDISQEVSDVVPGTTTTGLNSPTFSQRVVRTRVAVQDGQTVGLAGLIRDNASRGNQGIPWLSNIPILGSLVSTQDNNRQRTELLVLITPRVISDQRDARALTEDLRDSLSNAAALPGELQSLPLSGSPDPQARVRRRLGLDPR
ncbi:type II secretion system secretin GspD [Pararoseomonas indoligenes]|uniref:Type II secretion system secretin GspD n=1 Tax=Roseomonas indoligenes TaxID=2820811 RepID=A0A940N1E6_9PROT|nr:type II secretion system secretin GspD [Pararoseomonas indoligenes]MBP0494955.1 type II secretion system secretin GspD [Pararoseomonas indoligenes]